MVQEYKNSRDVRQMAGPIITFKPSILIAILASIVWMEKSLGASPPDTPLLKVPVETIRDKIRGGLLGQMLGNLNGLPHENTYIDEPGEVKSYTPALPNGAWTDDDTDFEWVYIIEMQRKRNAFLTNDEIFSLWKERINQRIWCSNRYARYLMDIDIKPPLTGAVSLNPWAEFNISGQFLSETFGLIAPAMPQTAAKIGLNYTTVAISGEPAQTTQLFTAMIATAFIENDIDKVLAAGYAALDSTSNTLKIFKDIKKWHRQYSHDWKETRRLLKEKYTQEGGRMRDWNGTELNTGSIIAALLYGEGDFAETVKLAFNFGWDADCNAATVGTILGVMTGYRAMLSERKIGRMNNRTVEGWMIVDRYRNTTRDNMPMDETITSFADRIIDLFEMVNENNGGRRTLIDQTMMYEIPQEKPAPIIAISSAEDQKARIVKEFEQEIVNGIVTGNRQEKARAVFMAVNLGLNKDLVKKYPKQWKEAVFDLSGYWKIMNNIFFGDFKALDRVKDKFVAAGFNVPIRKYTDSELYNDKAVWKNPSGLY